MDCGSAALGWTRLGSSGSGCGSVIPGSRLWTGRSTCVFILELRPNGQQLSEDSSSHGAPLKCKNSLNEQAPFKPSTNILCSQTQSQEVESIFHPP